MANGLLIRINKLIREGKITKNDGAIIVKAVDKSIIKRIKFAPLKNWYIPYCPFCKTQLDNVYDVVDGIEKPPKNNRSWCVYCGQLLDWESVIEYRENMNNG